MGTIAEKLTYLNTTKTMLKDSLNKFGSSILTTDTFRSYDTKLNDIYDKLPKVTQSGAGFTLSDVQNGLLDDFKMIGVDLEQDTTTGKNKFNGELESGIYNDTNGNKNTSSNNFRNVNPIEIKPNTTYIFSINGVGKAINVLEYAEDMTYIGRIGTGTVSASSSFTTSNNAKYISIFKGNSDGTEKWQIQEGATITSYEPYTGGIPSPNPDYPQEIKVVEGRQVITDSGKNTYDEEYELGYYNIPDGTKVYPQDSYGYRSTNLNELKPNTEYKISVNGELFENSIRLFYYDKNKTFLSASSTSSGKFTTPNNCYYFAWHSSYLRQIFQDGIEKLMFSDTIYSLDYEPYHEPVSYNIDLQLANIYLAKMPNTDYKNRVYKSNNNWYFEENVKKLILDGTEYWMAVSASDGSRFSCTKIKNSVVIPSSNADVGLIYCDKFSAISSNNTSSSVNGIAIASSGNIVIYYDELKNYDATQFKTWLSNNNLEICYPVTTPTTTQITNTTLINQLEAISVHTGTNIITISNDNNIIPEIEITRLKELEKLS